MLNNYLIIETRNNGKEITENFGKDIDKANQKMQFLSEQMSFSINTRNDDFWYLENEKTSYQLLYKPLFNLDENMKKALDTIVDNLKELVNLGTLEYDIMLGNLFDIASNLKDCKLEEESNYMYMVYRELEKNGFGDE